MSQPEIKDESTLITDTIRRIVTYTEEITYFGPNSAGFAIAKAFAAAISQAYRLYLALLRRYSLQSSRDEVLVEVADEFGTVKRPAQHARIMLVVQPHSTQVTAITGGDEVEVVDSSQFAATDSIRIRNEDGTETETAIIGSITIGTGPGGGDELILTGVLSGTYTPATDDTVVLLRHAVVIGTQVDGTTGVAFKTLETVNIGDSNPLLNGESQTLALADKVWAEAVQSGEQGNVDPKTVAKLTVADPKVKAISNPERGQGGEEDETDFDLKYRASHRATIANQDTMAWFESALQAGNVDVLRAIPFVSTSVNTVGVKLLKRNGGTFTANEMDALKAYVEARLRSGMNVELVNTTLTAVEIEAQVTLDRNVTLEEAWRRAADRYAIFLDWRKWPAGDDVDEADLLGIMNQTEGVATVVTSTFRPASDVLVADDSFPNFTRLSMQDTATGDTINAELAVTF